MIRKNLLLLILAILSFNISALAQEKSKSQLHMKSGELITGIITSRDDNKVVILEDGVSNEYIMADIAYISHATKPKKYNKKRFRGFFDVGYSLGFGTPKNNIFKLETSFGYQFSQYLYVGGGIAVHKHNAVLKSYPLRTDLAVAEANDPHWFYPFVPVYANVRSQLYEGNRFTPFADLKIGYSVFNNYGFLFAPAIGIHIPTTSTLSLNFTVGYSLQTSSYKHWVKGNTPGAILDGIGSTYLDTKVNLSALDIKLGIEF